MRTLLGVLSALIPVSRGLCFQYCRDILLLVVFRVGTIAPWLGSLGRDLGDPHITTDSWASPDCSVSGAGPAAAPGRLPARVINTSTAKKVHHAAVLALFMPQDTCTVQ